MNNNNEQGSAGAPQERAAVPKGFVLVPLHMTAEMRRVTDEEGWQWEDLLAAAESITEDQYDEISAPVAQEGEQNAQYIPANFTTHRTVWRDAITECINVETAKGNNDQAAYWQHELAAYDRAFARLLDNPETIKAATPPTPSKEGEQGSTDASAQALADMERRKDAAYLERNQVVAALAKCFPSGLARTAIEGWSEDWHGCVYIDLPSGQVSWHFHDSQAYLFDGLPPYTGKWDGHDTPEKYRRVAALSTTHPTPSDSASVDTPELREILHDLCALWIGDNSEPKARLIAHIESLVTAAAAGVRKDARGVLPQPKNLGLEHRSTAPFPSMLTHGHTCFDDAAYRGYTLAPLWQNPTDGEKRMWEIGFGCRGRHGGIVWPDAAMAAHSPATSSKEGGE